MLVPAWSESGNESIGSSLQIEQDEEEQMATAVNQGSSIRSGVFLAIAVVLGLLALVAVNFSNNPPNTAPTFSAPTLPHQ